MSALDGLDPSIRDAAKWFLNTLQAAHYNPVVTSVRRSYSKQQKLYLAFLAGRSKYPAAPPGTSKHERGLAFDIDLNLGPDVKATGLANAGRLWESLGGRWGGRFHDPIHFEV